MSSSNNDEEYKWPESGNAGPDVEWEGDVPIEIPEIPGPAETPTLPPISPGTEDQGKDAEILIQNRMPFVFQRFIT